MTYNEQAMIHKVSSDGVPNQLGTWTINGGLEMKYDASTVVSGRRFFRVGTAKVSLHFISGSAYHDIIIVIVNLTSSVFVPKVYSLDVHGRRVERLLYRSNRKTVKRNEFQIRTSR